MKRLFIIVALAGLVVSGCGRSTEPVANCGPNGVLWVEQKETFDAVGLIVVDCKNGHVYEDAR